MFLFAMQASLDSIPLGKHTLEQSQILHNVPNSHVP